MTKNTAKELLQAQTPLKIFVLYHKKFIKKCSDILIPMHVGRDIAKQACKDGKLSKKNLKWLTENLIGDNTGQNISRKNREWCELTGIYWAWKNYDKAGNPDYIGFMHYRRFFDFSEFQNNIEIINFVKNYDMLILQHTKYDSYYQNNYGKYKFSKYHHIEDLEKALDIVKKNYPKYIETIEQYLQLDYEYYCNMFIMKKDLFFEYCEWIFSILEQLEKDINISNYNIQERRVFGYIAERLTSIFYLNLLKDNTAKCKELPLISEDEIIKSSLILRLKNLIRKIKPFLFEV